MIHAPFNPPPSLGGRVDGYMLGEAGKGKWQVVYTLCSVMQFENYTCACAQSPPPPPGQACRDGAA